jgi:predicted PurR-regulated permease PerM
MISSRTIFWLCTAAVTIGLVILFQNVLLPFVLGATIAYLLNPAVTKITAKGFNRTAAVLMILGTFMTAIIIFLAVTIPVLVREAGDFIDAAPGYADKIWNNLSPYLSSLRGRLGFESTAEMTDQIQVAVKDNIGKTLGVSKNIVGTVAAGLAIGGQAIMGFIGTVFLIPIVAFFMMREWPKIVAWVYSLVPRHHIDTVKSLMNQIDVKIAGFIRGQLTVCFVLGLFYALGLSIAGLNYGFLIGLGTGFLCIIPFAGAAIGLVAALSVAALQSGGDLAYIGIVAGIFAVGQFLEGNFVSPKLIGDSVGLHPLWIIFALLAGGSLLGLLGMFLAIPVAAIISVLIAFAITQYRDSPYYQVL